MAVPPQSAAAAPAQTVGDHRCGSKQRSLTDPISSGAPPSRVGGVGGVAALATGALGMGGIARAVSFPPSAGVAVGGAPVGAGGALLGVGGAAARLPPAVKGNSLVAAEDDDYYEFYAAPVDGSGGGGNSPMFDETDPAVQQLKMLAEEADKTRALEAFTQAEESTRAALKEAEVSHEQQGALEKVVAEARRRPQVRG